MLGIDVGDRRIGVASADGLLLTAQGLEVYWRKSPEKDIAHFKELIESRNEKVIVVGYPKNMNGTEGEACEKVKAFVNSVLEVISEDKKPEIIYWDERLTTVAAHKSMLEGDLSRNKRKNRVDKIAAEFILQGYLDKLYNEKKK